MDHEIACLDINLLDETSESTHICAVGLWTDISIRIINLPSLNEMHKEMLGGGKFKRQKSLNILLNWIICELLN